MPGEEAPRRGRRVFAPLRIPLERRLQTAVLALWILVLPISLLLCGAALGALAFFWEAEWAASFNAGVALVGLYALWMLKDQRWRRDGGRAVAVMRSRAFQRLSDLYCRFFPSQLTIDSREGGVRELFVPSKNYLFCCHPHGVFGLGVWCSFVANGSHNELARDLLFPDEGRERVFDLTVHTMAVNFKVPLWREFLIALGFCSVDRKTLLHGLAGKKGQRRGRICVLVPGGAAESIDCTMPLLTLKKRKGFVRVALETGCSLVPVYTFGETALYKPLVGNPGRLRRLLFAIQKTIGVGVPLVCGRGIFNYAIGVLPHREPLHTVIGKPIAVPHLPRGTYTDADVDRVHAEYVAAVKALYAKYQPNLDPSSPYKELMIR